MYFRSLSWIGVQVVHLRCAVEERGRVVGFGAGVRVGVVDVVNAVVTEGEGVASGVWMSSVLDSMMICL